MYLVRQEWKTGSGEEERYDYPSQLYEVSDEDGGWGT